MKQRRSSRVSPAWLVVLLVAGCGGSSDDALFGGSGDVAVLPSAPPAAGGTTAGTPAAPGASGTSTAPPSNPAAPAPKGLASLGSLVVLGDSISDGGGGSPFYYDLLRSDLQKHYGTLQYANNAQSGSQTSALSGQVDGLPRSLKGPVAVCITSGGNDMKASLPMVLAGMDDGARKQMGTNIHAALGKLLAPGRFGAGVEVHVFEANIYDASDGKGDFGSHNCAFGKGVPTTPSDGFFKSWNDEIGTQIAGEGQVLNDIHAHFRGHGYASNPSWYASDCTHPSSTGHDQLRREFYALITGQDLP